MSEVALQSRQCVGEVILRIVRDDLALDDALNDSVTFKRLDERERRFSYQLLMSYWRHKGMIERLIVNSLDRKLPRGSDEIRTLLELGACELLYMSTPDYAAVNSYVTLAKNGSDSKKSGLVNAVLKRIAQEKETLLASIDSVQLSVPGWLWKSWKAAYGEKNTHAMITQQQQLAPLDLSVKSDVQGWAERLGGKVIAEKTVRVENQSVSDMDGYEAGEWWVQDVAASFPVQLLGDVSGKNVLDLCAAPGGKTAQLVNAGAQVSALDRSARRLERLYENLKRLSLSANVIEADVMEWKLSETYDMILLDAPCSATGTARRNPDVLWRQRPAKIKELASLQNAMIKRASAWLKPGGMMVYCVCSLQPEEGEKQALRIQNECNDLELVDIMSLQSTIPTECITKRGMLRCLPHYLGGDGGMDGFFAALFRKID